MSIASWVVQIRKPVKLLPALVALACLAALGGCSSGSAASPFRWGAGLFSRQPAHSIEDYQNDIRNYVERSSRSDIGMDELARGVAAIGERYGIADWEADMVTYTGIGEGLARADISQQQVDAYKSGLSCGDYTKSAAIQRGYERGL